MLVGLYALHSAWAAVLLYHAGVVAIWLVVGHRPGIRALLTGFRTSAAVPLMLAGLAAGPIVFLIWPFAAHDSNMAALLARFGLTGGSLIAFAVYSALANPVFEELFWRGMLLDEARWPAPVDALFAGYHVLVLALVIDWPFVLIAALVLATASWIWRMATVRYGGIAAPYFSHLAADLAVIGAVWALAVR